MSQYNFVYSRSLGCYHSGINHSVAPMRLLVRANAAQKRRDEKLLEERSEAIELLRPLFADGISDNWLLYYARYRGLITESEYRRWV